MHGEMSAVRKRRVNVGKKRIVSKNFEFKPLEQPRIEIYSRDTIHWKLFRNVTDFLLDREEDETHGVRVFPKATIFIIMLLTFWSRRNIVNSRESWWMMHPDEVYQSIEVAHSEVYGYGFRPYEYLSPPLTTASDPTTVSESQRINLGMYSLRSWMLPRVYIILFQLREYFQWTDTPYKIARLFHAMVAAILPFIIYKLSRKVFGGSRDVACVSATFASFCKPLLLLQTRTFVQSLLAPFVWLAITFLVSLVKSNTAFSLCATSNMLEIISLMVCGTVLGLAVYIRVDALALLFFAGVFLLFSFPKWTKCLQMLCPLAFGVFLGTLCGGFDDRTCYGKWFISPKQWLKFQLKYAARIFGKEELSFYLQHVVFTNHSFYVLVPISVCITLYYMHHRKKLRHHYLSCYTNKEDITGTKLPVENKPISSEILDETYTAILNQSNPQRQLPPLEHPNPEIVLKNEGLWGSNYAPILEGICNSTLMTLCLFTLYSFQSHKEVRFVHDAIVSLTMCCGATAYVIFRAVYERAIEAAAPPMAVRRIIKLVLYTELLLFAFDSRLNLPASRDKSNLPWTYAGLFDSGDVNQCLEFISKQTDVTGVFLDYSIHMTGGYALLHHDVPIIAKTHFEFREWCLEKRVNVSSKWFFFGKREIGLRSNNVSITTIDDVCDYISVLNAKYALKRLVEQPKYNYVVIAGDTQFLKKGFRKVFNSSNAIVYKRTSHKTEVEYLEALARQINMTNNATVLEYEASWLLTLNLPSKALERLQNAMVIDKNKVKVWQLMVTALRMMGDLDNARDVMNQCYKSHGRQVCLQSYPKVVLHQEYKLDITD